MTSKGRPCEGPALLHGGKDFALAQGACRNLQAGAGKKRFDVLRQPVWRQSDNHWRQARAFLLRNNFIHSIKE